MSLPKILSVIFVAGVAFFIVSIQTTKHHMTCSIKGSNERLNIRLEIYSSWAFWSDFDGSVNIYAPYRTFLYYVSDLGAGYALRPFTEVDAKPVGYLVSGSDTYTLSDDRIDAKYEGFCEAAEPAIP